MPVILDALGIIRKWTDRLINKIPGSLNQYEIIKKFRLMKLFICLRGTINMNKVSKVTLATVVEGDQKAPFSIGTTPRYRGGRY